MLRTTNRRLSVSWLAVAATLAIPSGASDDELHLELHGGHVRATRVAVTVAADSPASRGSAETIQQILGSDLGALSAFRVATTPAASDLQADGRISRSGDRLTLILAVRDTSSQAELFSRSYAASTTRRRHLAHAAADDLTRVVTGRPGPFLERISFVTDRAGRRTREEYLLYLADPMASIFERTLHLLEYQGDHHSEVLT